MGCFEFSPEINTATTVPLANVPLTVTVGLGVVVLVTTADSVHIRVLVVLTVTPPNPVTAVKLPPVSPPAVTLVTLGLPEEA